MYVYSYTHVLVDGLTILDLTSVLIRKEVQLIYVVTVVFVAFHFVGVDLDVSQDVISVLVIL